MQTFVYEVEGLLFSSLEGAMDFIAVLGKPDISPKRREVLDGIYKDSLKNSLKIIEFDYINCRIGEEEFNFKEVPEAEMLSGGQTLVFEVFRQENDVDKRGKEASVWNIKGRFVYEGSLEGNGHLILFICRHMFDDIKIMEEWGRSEEDIKEEIHLGFSSILETTTTAKIHN